MTREEAVIILDGFKNNPLFSDTHAQAFDMAISALSAEGDLISRQAVFNIIEREQFKGDAISEIEKLPSVENKGEWIPVSERLPEDEEDVLVYCGQYCGQGTVKIAYYHHDYTFYSIEFKDLNETGWYDENDDAMYPEPIAWMPLPEPYKKGGE